MSGRKHGGKRPGAGRKKADPAEALTSPVMVRLTARERAELDDARAELRPVLPLSTYIRSVIVRHLAGKKRRR